VGISRNRKKSKNGLCRSLSLRDNETLHHRSAVLRSTTIMRKFWRLAAECLVASLALILLTVILYRLHLNLATASLLYVIVVVLLSRSASFASSIVASVLRLCAWHILLPPLTRFELTIRSML